MLLVCVCVIGNRYLRIRPWVLNPPRAVMKYLLDLACESKRSNRRRERILLQEGHLRYICFIEEQGSIEGTITQQ